MSEPVLEPFTAEVLFLLSEPVGDAGWKRILTEYMQGVARQCIESGAVLIGHIKGLVLGPRDDYLRISVTDTQRRADVEGALAADYGSLALRLNVIVYGISWDVQRRCAECPVTGASSIEVRPVAKHDHEA
jgi:hypothetical protein